VQPAQQRRAAELGRQALFLMINIILTPWVWVSIGGAVVAYTWWRSLRFRRAWFRALLTAFSIALFFTPFIPHASVQWSTPWPPAIVWFILSLGSGTPDTFELFSIATVTAVLWVILFAVFRRRKHPNDPA